jgi:HSP20 family protein
MDDLKKDFLKDVRHIQEEMDLLFDHFYKMRHSPVLTSRRLWRPPTDVFETENEVVVLLEIAGMRQKDFSITLSDDVLTVKGERNEKAEPSKTGYRNKEINFGMFERNIYLPENLDPEDINASYRGGFLEIIIKKKKGKKSKAKEIKIEEG